MEALLKNAYKLFGEENPKGKDEWGQPNREIMIMTIIKKAFHFKQAQKMIPNVQVQVNNSSVNARKQKKKTN